MANVKAGWRARDAEKGSVRVAKRVAARDSRGEERGAGEAIKIVFWREPHVCRLYFPFL